MTVLELVHGIPLWIKAVEISSFAAGRLVCVEGPLNVDDRNFSAIICRQMEFVKRLDVVIREENHSGIKLEPDC
jgi:hypothetical protein